MFSIVAGITARIFSNSFLNVCQKILTEKGNKSSVINFYTYLGLALLGIFLIKGQFPLFSSELIINFILMGIFGALGNFFIIKSLSIGELSSIAPINSYKPIVALIIAFFYLGELPSYLAISGILFIIIGTLYLYSKKSNFNSKAVFYRTVALIFSGSEAVFIKKILLLTNLPVSFALWAISGFIFSAIFLIGSKHIPKINSIKYQLILISMVAIMQYSTNFVFSKIDVSSALALFQLSTLLSVFFGVNVFHETGLRRKIIASCIMIFGAAIIILN